MALAAGRQDQVLASAADTTVYDWQGAQITLICFDELTHFTAHQFFYMVSRKRRPRCGSIRATCNPDADSWSPSSAGGRPETGLPILERAGVLRYASASRRRSGPIALTMMEQMTRRRICRPASTCRG
jgi:hypothetical protein